MDRFRTPFDGKSPKPKWWEVFRLDPIHASKSPELPDESEVEVRSEGVKDGFPLLFSNVGGHIPQGRPVQTEDTVPDGTTLDKAVESLRSSSGEPEVTPLRLLDESGHQ